MFINWEMFSCSFGGSKCEHIIRNETSVLSGSYLAMVSIYISIISMILISNIVKFINDLSKFKLISNLQRYFKSY